MKDNVQSKMTTYLARSSSQKNSDGLEAKKLPCHGDCRKRKNT